MTHIGVDPATAEPGARWGRLRGSEPRRRQEPHPAVPRARGHHKTARPCSRDAPQPGGTVRGLRRVRPTAPLMPAGCLHGGGCMPAQGGDPHLPTFTTNSIKKAFSTAQPQKMAPFFEASHPVWAPWLCAHPRRRGRRRGPPWSTGAGLGGMSRRPSCLAVSS